MDSIDSGSVGIFLKLFDFFIEIIIVEYAILGYLPNPMTVIKNQCPYVDMNSLFIGISHP